MLSVLKLSNTVRAENRYNKKKKSFRQKPELFVYFT